MWRLIVSGPGSGAWNLALDEAIFASVRAGASPPTLRLYRWSPPALTIGYAQDRERDVDREACRARGIAVIRRVTGGRAVLHDAELTYSVSAPAGQPGFGAGLDAAYRTIAAGLVAGLRLLGAPAALSAPAHRSAVRAPRQPACFAAAARHEIEVGGRKLVGSAQRREHGAFLQQGSILLESHDDLLGKLLRRHRAPHGAAGMAGLADVLPRAPAPEAAAAAVVDGCAAAWGVHFRHGEITPAEAGAARALERTRYRSEEWNAGRRPVAGGAGPADGESDPGRPDGCVDMSPVRSYHDGER